MKTQNGSKVWIAVLVAMLALLGCPTDSDPAKNGEAALTSISVADTAVATVPVPVPRNDWDGAEFDPFSPGDDKTGELVIRQASALEEAQISVTASAGARVKYAAVENGGGKPQSFQDSPITLNINWLLVIQVTSEDGNAVNYYVIKIRGMSSNTTLTMIKVGDVELDSPASGEVLTASLGGDLTGKQVTVTKDYDKQTVEFARVSGGAEEEEPVYAETDTFDFENGDLLYIKVTAENGTSTRIYTIEIWGIRAAIPVISPAELPNATYTINEAAEPLTVTVSLPDLEEIPATSAITYQWYRNGEESNSGGTPLENETTASFTPPTTALGTAWYYVVVTHTDSSISAAPAGAYSTPARIRVVQTVEKVESIVAGSSNTVVYRFTLPQGKKWSDYTKMTWEVLVDDMTTINMAATRAHIMGNYAENVFNNETGVYEKLQGWNEARLVTISNTGSMSAILGSDYEPHTWKALEYSIAADNSLKDTVYKSEYYPAAGATGPFFFGIGLSVNPNNNSTGVCRYFVRRMALSNDDGTDKVYADDLTTSWGNGLALMDLKCIFNKNTEIQRSLVNNPVPDEE
jgi:hypothetical protein